jgi:sec-independent protein translocase protein TatA
MGGFSIWHWLVVLAIVLLLFGGNKISNVMGEFGKGLKSFKKGLEEDPVSEKTTTINGAEKTETTQKNNKV